MNPPLRALMIDEEELAILSRAIEQIPVTVVITDIEGSIEYVNPKFTELTGYTATEAIGQNPRILKSGKMDQEEYRRLWKTITVGNEWHGEFLNKKKNGEFYCESASISAIKNSQGVITHFIAVKEDITESKKTMEQLRMAQKMEAVGLLAGGISHDFNNLLTVINGYSNLLIHDLAGQPTLRDQALKILRAGERAAELTHQLLSFSRKQILDPRILNINSIVNDLEKMLSRIIGEQIELVTILSEQVGMVKADSGQLQQIIMNLAVNARDAVTTGGRITIETANRDIDAGFVHENMGAVPGEYVMLSVTDNGPGMSDEVKSRIFEPFFTTKEQGKGTGLGLATVYGIVKQSEGYIQVISAPGQGASFRVFLPRVHQQPDQQGKTREAIAPAGKQTILAVDDKLEVLNFIAQALSKHGYTVIRANSPNEALKLFDQQMDQIDLLLTDVVMPSMSGPQLARELLAKKPALKVIFMSGHPTDVDHFQEIIDQGMAFLTKPFINGALIDKVGEALG
ncbi:MAG: PAS domain S-box protein [Geobacteraceae bacterium]